VPIATAAFARRLRALLDADLWFAARIRRIEEDAAGDALPEVAKVRPGLYVTLTDGSAVQITVEHIQDPLLSNARVQRQPPRRAGSQRG